MGVLGVELVFLVGCARQDCPRQEGCGRVFVGAAQGVGGIDGIGVAISGQRQRGAQAVVRGGHAAHGIGDREAIQQQAGLPCGQRAGLEDVPQGRILGMLDQQRLQLLQRLGEQALIGLGQRLLERVHLRGLRLDHGAFDNRVGIDLFGGCDIVPAAAGEHQQWNQQVQSAHVALLLFAGWRQW